MRPLQKDVIARAASLKQTTLTNFMVEHAFQRAQQILADQVHFYLSREKWDAFCATLDAPPRTNRACSMSLSSPVPITRNHDTSSCDCGVEPRIVPRTHVAMRENRVAEYYTLAAGSVSRGGLRALLSIFPRRARG